MEIHSFDTVILGGGPAGFSAGLYAARGKHFAHRFRRNE